MTDDGRPLIDDGAARRNRTLRARRAQTDPASPSTLIRRVWLERLARFFLVAGICALFAALSLGVIGLNRPAEIVALAPAPIQTILPTILPLPTLTPTATPTPLPPLIGLLAGHSGGADPGAVCPDGLREVDITVGVSQRAKTMLETRGYRVDILAEFDKRLDAVKRDYAPRVFLAIHADSCVNYASGYKVARAANSATPELDDRLVRCVSVAYAAESQLPFHEGSITRDMTHYHGLMKIHPESAGAIIELGFLGSDKKTLRDKTDALALGIAEGIDRFLKGNGCQ